MANQDEKELAEFVQLDPQRFATILVDDSAEWESATAMIKKRDAKLLAEALRPFEELAAWLDGRAENRDKDWRIYGSETAFEAAAVFRRCATNLRAAIGKARKPAPDGGSAATGGGT